MFSPQNEASMSEEQRAEETSLKQAPGWGTPRSRLDAGSREDEAEIDE